MLPIIDTPLYELILPSSGEKIKYRPFIVKEHKILMTMQEADSNEVLRIIKELIFACTFGKLDADSLPHFDIVYVFLQLRAKSIGEEVNVVITCDCGNDIDSSFNLENVIVHKDPNHNTKIKLDEKYYIEMKYPNFTNVLAIFNSDLIEDKINVIVDSIKAIYTKEEYWDAKEQTREDLVRFIENLTNKKLEKIEEFFRTEPKIVQEFNVTCDKCGKENYAKLEGLAIFFV